MTQELKKADALYRAGRMEEAAELCRHLVERDPDDAEAWHQLGLTEAALGRMPQALQHLEQAVALRPMAAVFHANFGLALGLNGDWERAAGAYRQAVEIRPDHAESLAKLGRALARTGEMEEAIARLEEAVALEATPDHCNALGAALAQAGRLDEASQWLRRALADDPAHEEARANLAQTGESALRRGAARAALLEWAEALEDFETAMRAMPDHAEAHFHAGLAATALGELQRACRFYERSAILRPGYAEAWNNWAHVELALGRAPRALELALRATQERPGYADAHYNAGVILQDLDQPEQAASAYQRVLNLAPRRADAWNNLGSLALGRNHWPQAIEKFDQALAIEPCHIDARWNRALTLLTLGCWDAGWPQYEARLEREEYRRRVFAAPRWQGEDLAGCSILVWAEQGLGDTLQFLRLVPPLEARGARVCVECQPRLQPLLAGSGLWAIARGAALPATDFEIPLMSLPARMGMEPDTVPPPYAYTVPAERVDAWRARIGNAGAGLKVGLVWGAQVANFAGRNRSLALSLLAGLSEVLGVRLIAVQHGPQREEVTALGSDCIERFDEPQGDLLDTAALIVNLDLLITVDTMTAHLAASLGKPVWTLLPFAADWRWMQTSEPAPASRTVWYPSMRLFRQPRPGDWTSVAGQVKHALARWATGSV